MVRVSSPAKLRPWSELTAKMVMGVVPGLVSPVLWNCILGCPSGVRRVWCSIREPHDPKVFLDEERDSSLNFDETEGGELEWLRKHVLAKLRAPSRRLQHFQFADSVRKVFPQFHCRCQCMYGFGLRA